MKFKSKLQILEARKNEIRFAVVDVDSQATMSANHRNHKEAYAVITDLYGDHHSLILVAHRDEKILGEVSSTFGNIIKKQPPKLPETIWHGPVHTHVGADIDGRR